MTHGLMPTSAVQWRLLGSPAAHILRVLINYDGSRHALIVQCSRAYSVAELRPRLPRQTAHSLAS